MKRISVSMATACLLFGLSATAQNLIVNGDFASDLSGWNTQIGANANATITYDGTLGNPDVGSALLARATDTTLAANGNYLWQTVPVTSGLEYILNADWKGALLGDPGVAGRNWAEVFVGFAPDDTVFAGNIQYKKATSGDLNVAADGIWDWESILTSPNSATTGPADGVFVATDAYMIVGFNVGGRATVGAAFYNVDNVSVTLVPEPSSFALFGLAGLGLAIRRFRR